MDVSAIYNNSTDIQSLLINSNKINYNDIINSNPNYAQKGEPMYMVEMDTDEDGVVSLDEFKDYCKSKNIGTREMVKMSSMAASYRIMKAESEAIDYISRLIPNVFPKLKESESEPGLKSQDKDLYNISDNTSYDKMVTYEEYMEFCEQNVIPSEQKNNTKAEETETGVLDISNYGKAIESYKNNENCSLCSTFENVV